VTRKRFGVPQIIGAVLAVVFAWAPVATDTAQDARAITPEKKKGAPASAGSPAEKSESASGDEAAVVEGDEVAESLTSQVEIFLPSVTEFFHAAQESNAGKLVAALSGVVRLPRDETGEGFDFGALIDILSKVCDWPDTSLVVTTFTQDRDGRPRWAVEVDWTLAELRGRVAEIVEDERAKRIFEGLRLVQGDDGSWRIELPDVVLAVLVERGQRSMAASAADVLPPDVVFGKDSVTKKNRSLLYCRLNLEDADEGGPSLFTYLSGVTDIRYAARVTPDGQWLERLNLRWNPLLGSLLKLAFRKTETAFECPQASIAVGAIHLGTGDGLADTIAGLPIGTIGSRADGEMAFSVVAGEGFFPIPEMYYQFEARGKKKIIKSIRKAIRKDTEERRNDDREPTWHETKVGDRVVFWKDPSADGVGGISFATFRTVVFFDDRNGKDENGGEFLVLAETTGWPDDAVERWDELMRKRKDRITIPSSEKVHWQLVVSWKTVYELVQPYLALTTAISEESELAPPAEAMAPLLGDSTIDVKILFSGLDVRQKGPIPFGAAFVPGVTAASLMQSASWDSEAAREQIACRHLRTLHHHAELFNKDYGRWPATVAELDGYIDFASHPDLLQLRPKDDGFLKGFVSMFTADRKSVEATESVFIEEDEIDESLYEIEWSPDAWKLKFREKEFHQWATIYIDEAGEIHRVPKDEDGAPPDSGNGKKLAAKS
jgi:hypothetical protein